MAPRWYGRWIDVQLSYSRAVENPNAALDRAEQCKVARAIAVSHVEGTPRVRLMAHRGQLRRRTEARKNFHVPDQ